MPLVPSISRNRTASVRLFPLMEPILSEEVDHSELTDSDLDLEDEP